MKPPPIPCLFATPRQAPDTYPNHSQKEATTLLLSPPDCWDYCVKPPILAARPLCKMSDDEAC